MLNKAFGMIKIDLKLFQIAKKFKPDILIGVHNPYVAHVGAILRKPVIIFTDTENVKIASLLTYPFVQIHSDPTFFQGNSRSQKTCKNQGFKRNCLPSPEIFLAGSPGA